MVGSGGPAASTFCESLADADAAALKRLIDVLPDLIGHLITKYLREILLMCYLFFVVVVPSTKTLHFMDSTPILRSVSTKTLISMDRSDLPHPMSDLFRVGRKWSQKSHSEERQ